MSLKIVMWSMVVGGLLIGYRKASRIVAEMDRVDQEQTAEAEKNMMEDETEREEV